jgi:hypothetical protein
MKLGYLLPTLNILRTIAGKPRFTYSLPTSRSCPIGWDYTRFAHIFDDKKAKLAAIVLSKFKLDWIATAILRAKMTDVLKHYVTTCRY